MSPENLTKTLKSEVTQLLRGFKHERRQVYFVPANKLDTLKKSPRNRVIIMAVQKTAIPADIKRLAKSIEKNGFSPMFPVIVDSQGNILDGHRRVYAAEIANSGVYVVVDESPVASVFFFSQLSALSKDWQLMDWTVAYANEEIGPYILAKEFVEYSKKAAAVFARNLSMPAWSVSPSSSYMFLLNKPQRVQSSDKLLISAGELELSDHDVSIAVQTLERVLQVQALLAKPALSQTLILIMIWLQRQTDYDHDRMMEKIRQVGTGTTLSDENPRRLISGLQEIYNFKIQKASNRVVWEDSYGKNGLLKRALDEYLESL